MKMLYRIFIVITVPFGIFAAPDCMDNSWYLEKENDLKEYHHVQCNCPCGKYDRNETYQLLADRNRCFQCGHFHDPRPIASRSSTSVKEAADTEQVSQLRSKTAHYLFTNKIHPHGKQLHALFHTITKP